MFLLFVYIFQSNKQRTALRTVREMQSIGGSME